MNHKYLISNNELAIAIESTWQMTKNTKSNAISYQSICDHLKFLMVLQRHRAELIKIDD